MKLNRMYILVIEEDTDEDALTLKNIFSLKKEEINMIDNQILNPQNKLLQNKNLMNNISTNIERISKTEKDPKCNIHPSVTKVIIS